MSSASAQTNPFEAILTRNVFGLVPVPPPPKPEPPPLPKITLTGITTVTGEPRALLKMPAPTGKTPGATGGELYFNLRAGEREGDVQVLEIDERASRVVLTYTGREMTLGFEKDVSQASIVQPVSEPTSVPSPLPNPPGFASRGPEENVLLYEANRARNEQRIQAGIGLPKMPSHPWVNAANGQ